MIRVAVGLTLIAMSVPAFADDARTLYERGSTAYALGHYDEAAELFERSFAASNKPVLLYDAAQAHRLAGHKERALELYRSYLRATGEDAPHRAEVVNRVARLSDELSNASRPLIASPSDASTVARAPDRRLLVRRPWLWVAVGGTAVAVGLAVGLGVGLGTSHPPAVTIGQVPLN